MRGPEENLFHSHHRTGSNISNITAIDALNHTRNIPHQFEGGDKEEVLKKVALNPRYR
jgi:hypothetical protein